MSKKLLADSPLARNVLRNFKPLRRPPDIATFPRRPPRMRDDAVPFCGASDREFDEDHFAVPHNSAFRLLSASWGDQQHFGYREVAPAGYCFIRLSLFPYALRKYQRCWRSAAAIVFLVNVSNIPRLNAATDAELYDVWQWLISERFPVEISDPIYFEEAA